MRILLLTAAERLQKGEFVWIRYCVIASNISKKMIEYQTGTISDQLFCIDRVFLKFDAGHTDIQYISLF